MDMYFKYFCMVFGKSGKFLLRFYVPAKVFVRGQNFMVVYVAIRVFLLGIEKATRYLKTFTSFRAGLNQQQQ